ncbi:glutamate acetyltransferase [Oculatella sp. LEGE 06141]|nr:DALR anticodon-binding domain-containing protein [Oculatella sp. LEGE 06141]MBE9178890.1 glutamate acetyltransferase [Oculatella sp. LEGE 06141]
MEYTSAIALKLTGTQNRSATDIAQQIAVDLTQTIEVASAATCSPSVDRVWQGFDVQAISPGWIYFRLNPTGTAEWLQVLVDYMPMACNSVNGGNTENNNQILRNSTNIFKVQHVHARCCSLLRLADQEGLIRLNPAEGEASLPGWLVTEPYPLPWLSGDRLRLEHPSEYALIAQLVTVLDALSELPPTADYQARGLKLALALSQSFQRFYAACRLWGEAKTAQLPLVQTRLGLVRITQVVLQTILQEGLQLLAPLEL